MVIVLAWAPGSKLNFSNLMPVFGDELRGCVACSVSIHGCICYECTIFGECCGDTVKIKAVRTNVEAVLLVPVGG